MKAMSFLAAVQKDFSIIHEIRNSTSPPPPPFFFQQFLQVNLVSDVSGFTFPVIPSEPFKVASYIMLPCLRGQLGVCWVFIGAQKHITTYCLPNAFCAITLQFEHTRTNTSVDERKHPFKLCIMSLRIMLAELPLSGGTAFGPRLVQLLLSDVCFFFLLPGECLYMT